MKVNKILKYIEFLKEEKVDMSKYDLRGAKVEKAYKMKVK